MRRRPSVLPHTPHPAPHRLMRRSPAAAQIRRWNDPEECPLSPNRATYFGRRTLLNFATEEKEM